MQRRSSRAGNLRESAASALADLAARKASGTTRTADYELHQEADVYETVDEQTYAAIAARKRKEARDFIDAGDGASDLDDDAAGGSGGNAGAAAMELEFEMEDELSLVRSANAEDRKRKRSSAPNRSLSSARGAAASIPAKRVSTAFFNSFHQSGKANVLQEADDGAGTNNSVLNSSVLDAALDKHVNASRAARRKRRKAVQNAVGDLLFDSPSIPLPGSRAGDNEGPDGQLSSLGASLAPAVAPKEEYAAPPPSLQPKQPALPPPNNKPSASLLPSVPPPADPAAEDSLDPDLLVAAADAAVAEAAQRKLQQPPSGVAQPQEKLQRKPQTGPAPQQNFREPMGAGPRMIGDSSTFQLFPPNSKPARDENGDVLMFWTDAHDVRVNGGQHLYLFGKVPVNSVDSGVFASVCVHVEGMERVLYVLPRQSRGGGEPVKLVPDVYNEVSAQLLGPAGSGKGGFAARASNLPSSIKAKKSRRSYPFGDGLAPREPTEYLKVKFPYANTNRLEPDSSGETFVRAFGTRTSASEAFCMKRKLKGPGWLRLKNVVPLNTQVSHAKFGFSVTTPDDVVLDPDLAEKDPPTLSAMCINVKTVLNPKNGAHEIVMISAVNVREIPLSGSPTDGALEPGGTRDFTLVRPPDGKSIPFGFGDRIRSAAARGSGLEVVANEATMLNNFLAKLIRYDPDIVIGHDIMGFGLDVLLARMNARRSRDWSRLGRFWHRRDLSQFVKNNQSHMWFKAEAVAGRLYLDTYSHSKDLLTREKDYTLCALSHNVLAENGKGNEVKLPPTTDVSLIPNAFDTTDALCRLVMECSIEARTAGRLAAHLSVVPLTRQLTCISGNLWSHTMRGARAERIEYLLCHEFKLIGSEKSGSSSKAGDVESKLLLPDKLNRTEREKVKETAKKKEEPEVVEPSISGYGGPAGSTNGVDSRKENGAGSKKSKSSRRKPQYSGGLVLEPKKGFYDRYVLQLDFNSLYPSIIQEYNICFTTLDLSKTRENEDKEEEDGVEMKNTALALPSNTVLEGVLPRVLRRLVEQRRQVKKLLKEERQRAGRETLRAQQLDIRQLAIKLTANSLYGCLGFEGSRFFARPLAQMVTAQGRETLQNTVDITRDSFNAQVIYGDTDSIFVYTGHHEIGQVRKLGTELKRDVNKKYKTLEIEIDAIYKKMLLLKKKKYAALKVVDPTNPDKVVREVKGLDLVRHDWCDLSHEASEHFISQILGAQSSTVDDAIGNILQLLTGLAQQVNSNQVALSKYVITRALTKRPQDYSDVTSLPHVAVAMRLINEQKRRLKAGDYIKYVICKSSGDGQQSQSSGGLSSRAYHPDEVVASQGKLVIDVKYYLENQVLPPIMRLCEPMEAIDGSRIAVSLGLDGRRYERREDVVEGISDLALGPQSSADKFRDVEQLQIVCSSCGAKNDIYGVSFSRNGAAVKSTGLQCGTCLKPFGYGALRNAVTLSLRGWVQRYYTAPLVINGDDGSRRREARDVGLGGNAALARRQFDEAWLYKQLRYAHYVMDVNTRWEEAKRGEDGDKKQCPVAKADADIYGMLMRCVDEVFDANAYRFVDVSHFLAPLGLA